MPRQYLSAPVHACPVSFWDFALPVTVGSIAGGAAGFVARRTLLKREPPATRATAALVTQAAVFWIVAGSVWILRTRRPH